MNETKRSISGAVYIILLILLSYIRLKVYILFGSFLLIAAYEFCALVQLNKIIPLFCVNFIP
jgi:phosphatidate cytidylyltransferase